MISPETVAAVRERVNIVALIGENVRLTKAGRSHKGLCPFHKEKTPSFNVNPERGFFHCFGCGESGDAISYLMKLEGHTFPEAVKALADRYGIPIEENSSPVEADRAERQRRDKEELYALNQIAAVYYEKQLADGGHPLGAQARAELERRGLPHRGGGELVDEALAAFRIGYAPYGWDGLASYLRRQGVSAAAAERLGLIVRRRAGDGHYDAFRHRLMFPVIDRAGRVVAFSGRALEEPSAELLQRHGIASMSSRRSDEERRGPPKYVNSPESPIYVKGETVFGLYQARRAIREKGEAVIVEGNFDVVALHARGLTRVVAPLGTAFTPAQARLIKRYAPALVVLFDGDAAGKKATKAMRASAREGGLAVRVASLPLGTDPDDFARERGIAAVEAMVHNAKGMLEYLIDDTLGGQEAQGGSLEDKHLRIQQVLAYIAEEADPGLRGMAKAYADRLSSQLVVAGHSPTDIRSLERMVAQALHEADKRSEGPSDGRPAAGAEEAAGAGPAGADGRRQAAGAAAGPSRRRPGPSRIELAVLGALIEFPELLDDPTVEPELDELEGEAALAVAAIRQLWDEKKTLVGAELLDLLPDAIHAFAVGRLASPRHAVEAEARVVLLDNVEKIRRRALTGDKTAKVRELAQAQSYGDVDAEDELLRELDRVARRKRGLS